MIKKLLNVLLCISVLMQNFLFAVPAMAEEFNQPKIKINGLEQAGEKISIVDGIYIADKNEELWVDLELENTTTEDNYYVQIDSSTGGQGFIYSKASKHNIRMSSDKEIQTIDIKVCDDWECNIIYASETIKVKLSLYNEIKDSKFIISDIKQGNNKIEISDNKFHINNQQDVTFKLMGQNLLDNAKYVVSTGQYEYNKTYLGSELENGIYFTHYTNLSDYFDVTITLQGLGFYYNTYYYDGEKDIIPYFSVIEEENTTNYSANIIYTNFNNIIEKSNIEYRDYYILNSKYYNKNNSLSVKILGQNYIDKDYPISVTVKKGNELIYNKEENINGASLNNGHQLELNDLTLELNKEIATAELYDFYICINGITTKQTFKYNSIGKDINIDSNIFYENGKKNLSAFRGNGNYFFGSGIYDTNKNVFTKYSTIYLRFSGENFNVNEEYDYILEYGNYAENIYDFSQNYEMELKKGKVSGAVLNTIGLLFQVDNNQNYKNPSYRLTVKKGEEVLYSSAPVLYIVNSPTLANASLSANNKTLYLQTSDFSYIATRNAPIDIVISGLGFDDNTDYDFNYCYHKNYLGEPWDESHQKCENVKINGKDLNNGTAKIHFKDEIDEKAYSYNFYVMCDLRNTYSENVAIQGGFEVTFVDSKDLFPNLTKYFVDNVSDLIKNISKNTSVEDFTNNINVKDNGTVKIYDNTGTTEIIGTIGTGMIARVVNEYDESVLDLDVVVKGDVSGDGNISATDLDKVKRHLSGAEDLVDVYKVAGNVTDTGNIGPTDLVKIARDVAKIQEVQ